jgi:hypothetical protein
MRGGADNPVVLEELLDRGNAAVVGPEHGPGSIPARQPDCLHPRNHPILLADVGDKRKITSR